MTEGDKLYVNNINGSTDEFTVLGYGRSAKVNLLRRSCSYRKYDLVKLSCAHAMAMLCLKHGDEYGTSIYNHSSQMYSKESYLLAYLEPICAAPLELEWSVAREYLKMQVLPPDFNPKLERRKMENKDRTWMYNRLYPNYAGLREEYKAAVDGFIAKAMPLNDFLIEGTIRCPCWKCKCCKLLSPDVVTLHLYRKGFMLNYTVWTAHGESSAVNNFAFQNYV
ncbi:hypothetical protein T459_04343 [Capsicum annuum]|uniref:Transposase-associated domain-containing protein n=1 Tax=Capsicum annuum TaxID=4072 RepID=A0A2G3A4W1_CAPAN|nr:hypothetical protein T459_04343 [Capsicum annuum]